MAPTMLPCTACNANLPLGAQVCPACGARAGGAASSLARGIQLFTELRYEAALKELERARQSAPLSLSVRRCLAHGLYHTGQGEAASRLYRSILEQDPRDIEVRYNLAQILINQGRLDQARGFFEELVDAPVEILEGEFYFGLFFREAKHFHADCYYYLAIVCWNRGDTEAAEQNFLRALERNPGHAPASRHLGNLYLQAKNFSGAVEHYRTFLRLHEADGLRSEDVVEVTCNFGIASLELGELEQARERFTQVLRRHPGHPGAIYHLNLIYEREGMYSQKNYGPIPVLEDSEGASTIFGLARRGNEPRDAGALAPILEARPIVGKSVAMQRVLRFARLAAASEATVLITGENGTGKELIARAIHKNSARLDNVFMPVNCAAIPESLIESELFGHEKGAFTGAVERKFGLFEAANRGTIFLDEIGELDLNMQVKLLRFLQEREITRVGGTETIDVDVRIIAATNRNLDELLAQGLFRQDLYYRLNVLPIHVPPLRERPEDIPILIDHFIHKYGKGSVRRESLINQDDISVLTQYEWPGNIRELENVIERATVLGTQVIPIIEGAASRRRQREAARPAVPAPPAPSRREEPPSWPAPAGGSRPGEASGFAFEPLSIQELERQHILRTLDHTSGNRLRAARLLGINPTTLWRKMKGYAIESPEAVVELSHGEEE